MAIFQKTVWAFRCERCGHEWIPRKPWAEGERLPTVCPKCKSPYWNKPRWVEVFEAKRVDGAWLAAHEAERLNPVEAIAWYYPEPRWHTVDQREVYRLVFRDGSERHVVFGQGGPPPLDIADGGARAYQIPRGE